MKFDASGRTDRFRANSLQFPALGINSQRWQKNSLLVCVGNLLANPCIRGCFRDGFTQKAAQSAKFPAFFAATRELGTSRDYRIDPRQAAEDPIVGNRGMLERHASCSRRQPSRHVRGVATRPAAPSPPRDILTASPLAPPPLSA